MGNLEFIAGGMTLVEYIICCEESWRNGGFEYRGEAYATVLRNFNPLLFCKMQSKGLDVSRDDNLIPAFLTFLDSAWEE